MEAPSSPPCFQRRVVSNLPLPGDLPPRDPFTEDVLSRRNRTAIDDLLICPRARADEISAAMSDRGWGSFVAPPPMPSLARHRDAAAADAAGGPTTTVAVGTTIDKCAQINAQYGAMPRRAGAQQRPFGATRLTICPTLRLVQRILPQNATCPSSNQRFF